MNRETNFFQQITPFPITPFVPLAVILSKRLIFSIGLDLFVHYYNIIAHQRHLLLYVYCSMYHRDLKFCCNPSYCCSASHPLEMRPFSKTTD